MTRCTYRRFKLNQLIEVMDKEDPVRNCLATVTGIIGDRIHVRYYEREKKDQGSCSLLKDFFNSLMILYK